MHFLVACDNGIGLQLAYFLELQVVRSVVSEGKFYRLPLDKENMVYEVLRGLIFS